MAQQAAQQPFKLIIIGEDGVGKKSFVKRLLGRNIPVRYEPTMGHNVHEHVLRTNQGDIEFEIWDTCGQERPGRLRSEYYQGAKCVLLMFDITSVTTYREMRKWYYDIVRVTGEEIHFALVGNKIDLGRRPTMEKYITLHKKVRNMQYFEMSVMTQGDKDIRVPLLHLAERVIGMEPGTLSWRE